MKFRQINEENFLEKIERYLEGLDFARNCKNEIGTNSVYVQIFNENGYKLLFTENQRNWETFSDNYVFIDKTLSKLVVLQETNTGDKLIAVWEKGNFDLLHPSYVICYNKKERDILKVTGLKEFAFFCNIIKDFCNNREIPLEKETPRGKDYTALFRIMEKVTKKFGNIKIDKKYSIEQMNTITGGLSQKYVSNGELLFAIKAGCSLGQLLLYVRMLYTGQLDTGECLDIATSYYA